MSQDEEARGLQAHGLSYAEWAVLFTASYYYPLPAGQLVGLAADEGMASTREVSAAVEAALDRDWLAPFPAGPPSPCKDSPAPAGGLVLTDLGLRVKDAVASDLMATLYAGAA